MSILNKMLKWDKRRKNRYKSENGHKILYLYTPKKTDNNQKSIQLKQNVVKQNNTS